VPRGGRPTTSANQVTASTNPLGQTFAFGYDDAGNLTRLTDPRGHAITWRYDDSDRVTHVTDALGKTATTTYTPLGQPAQTTARSGKATSFGYDLLGRITQVKYGVSGQNAESTVGYAYDGADRLSRVSDTAAGGDTTFAYDDLDRVTSVTRPAGQISYTHDAADRTVSTTPAGRTPTTYEYAADGSLSKIKRGADEVVTHYDSAGRQERLTLPGGWSGHYAYDDDGRVNALTYKHGTTDKGKLTYSYDLTGRIGAIGGSLARVALPGARAGLAYDGANRLTSAGGKTLDYDLDGNLTGDGETAYTWNARGQLTGLNRTGLSAAFRYDAEGIRDRRTVNGAVTGYLTDGDNPIAETDASGTVTADLLSGAVDEWLTRGTSAGRQTYLRDLQGNTLALGADDGSLRAQYAYDPYGGASSTGSTGGNPFTYTGREDDGTGLMHYRSRYYSPTLGRFISEDPSGLDGGTNLYAYIGGDPVNDTDPSGRIPLLATCASGAALGGGMDYLAQRLSGRKVDWGSVGGQAALGCGLGGPGRAFGLGRAGSCLTNSFTGDTPVVMADGTRRPIRDLRVGDRVLATDPETGRGRAEPVTAVIEGAGVKELVRVSLDGGGTVVATDGHPFWVPDRREWVTADRLEPGMWLQTAAGTFVQISVVQRSREPAHVYNLTVGDTHTFHVGVGAADVLVHNSTCTVLGTRATVAPYLGRPGYNVPNRGTGRWSWRRNKAWVDDAIARGDEIRLTVDPHKPIYARGNVYQKELRYLRSLGYRFEQRGDYWVAIRYPRGS
jgi:RHS repeat-associated protein